MARLSPSIFFTALAFAVCANASAQPAYPNKVVRIIVPFGPGGAADALPRLIAAPLSSMWGQSVIVENRPGAAGNIGMELGAKAAPDGYTLTSAPVGNIALNPHLYSKLSFDILKDFTPITLIGSVQNVLVVHPSIPAKTVKELIALLKSRPGELTYASGGVGTQAHIAGELFKAMSNTNMTHVAYKGVGASVTDLLGGHVGMIFAQVHSVLPHIQAGKLRPLGVASVKRVSQLPNVPTIAEAAGVSSFEAVSWYALVGPANMPKDVTAKIQSDIARALQLPDVKEKLAALGADVVGSSIEETAMIFKTDIAKFSKVAQAANIRAD